MVTQSVRRQDGVCSAEEALTGAALSSVTANYAGLVEATPHAQAWARWASLSLLSSPRGVYGQWEGPGVSLSSRSRSQTSWTPHDRWSMEISSRV